MRVATQVIDPKQSPAEQPIASLGYDPIMTVHVKREAWPAISGAVSAAKGKVVAAIGYVNTGAFDQLPLKANDVLVCDVSPKTVANGSSNPQALIPFLNAGVSVFSKPGLHAKVVVLPKRAFVGSANASNNSAKRLFEAVLETTDNADILALRAFVNDLCNSPVTSQSVKALTGKYPKKAKQGPAATDPSRLPDQWGALTVVGLRRDEWTSQEMKAWKAGEPAAKDKASNSFSDYRITEFAWTAGEGSTFDEGRWVIQVIDDKPSAPGVVVHRQKHGTREIIWLAVPNEARPLSSIAELGPKAVAQGDLLVLKGKDADHMLVLHRALVAR
jgi:hypothetical protein